MFITNVNMAVPLPPLFLSSVLRFESCISQNRDCRHGELQLRHKNFSVLLSILSHSTYLLCLSLMSIWRFHCRHYFCHQSSGSKVAFEKIRECRHGELQVGHKNFSVLISILIHSTCPLCLSLMSIWRFHCRHYF
jgi:hypothetical protein